MQHFPSIARKGVSRAKRSESAEIQKSQWQNYSSGTDTICKKKKF